MTGHGRRNALIAMTIGIFTLVLGTIFTFSLISAQLIAFGVLLMAMGAITLLSIFGVFSGTPYRGRIMNRADREVKRRERRKYAD